LGFFLSAALRCQRLDLSHIHPSEEDDGQQKGRCFCDDERVPQSIQSDETTKQIGGWQQEYELSGDTDDHGDVSVAGSLEKGAEDNAETCRDEAKADALHGNHPDGHHLIGGVEPAEQDVGQEGEDGKAGAHD